MRKHKDLFHRQPQLMLCMLHATFLVKRLCKFATLVLAILVFPPISRKCSLYTGSPILQN